MDLVDQILARLWTPVLKLMFGVAIAFFIWGVIEFMVGAANEEKRETGKRHIVWGLVGLFIMFAVWAIMAVIKNFWNL